MEGEFDLPDPAQVADMDKAAQVITVAPFGDLTTTEEVRAIFGLSIAELPDSMLQQRAYQREVWKTAKQINELLVTDWPEILKSKPELAEVIKDFGLYCVCHCICDVLPVVIVRSLADSKAGFQRFDTDLQEVVNKIDDRYKAVIQELLGLLAEVAVKQDLPTLIAQTHPAYDPVTGE